MSGRHLYIEEHDRDDDPCRCGSCDWAGKFSDVVPVTDGVLNSGDASPAGRCPDEECDSFVYLDRPVDRAMDAVRSLLLNPRKAGLSPEEDAKAADVERGYLEALEAAFSEAWGLPYAVSIFPTLKS